MLVSNSNSKRSKGRKHDGPSDKKKRSEAEPGQTNRAERLFKIGPVIASLKGTEILDLNP